MQRSRSFNRGHLQRAFRAERARIHTRGLLQFCGQVHLLHHVQIVVAARGAVSSKSDAHARSPLVHTAATPLANIMLLEGLCTQPAWRSARIFMSLASSQMQCAARTSGPRSPILSRYCTGVAPFVFRLSTNSFCISAT